MAKQKSSTRGRALTMITNAYVAGIPTFFPGGLDSRTKDCLTFSVMINEGSNDDGSIEYKSTLPIKVWGPYSNTMAHLLDIGTCVNIVGRPQSYLKTIGVQNGQPQRINTVYFTAVDIHIVGRSLKKISDDINRNLDLMRNQGLLPPQTVGILTPEALLKSDMPLNIVPFNAAISVQTGKHGKANVWSKDRGTWAAGGTANEAVALATAGNTKPNNMNANQIQAMINNLQTLVSNMQNAGTTAENNEVVSLDENASEAPEVVAEETMVAVENAEADKNLFEPDQA